MQAIDTEGDAVGKYLTINMPEQGSAFASIDGTLDALGLLDSVLMHYRDTAPDETWKGLVIDTQFAIRHALSPYTYEDDGKTVVKVDFPRETIAVVMDAAQVVEAAEAKIAFAAETIGGAEQ